MKNKKGIRRIRDSEVLINLKLYHNYIRRFIVHRLTYEHNHRLGHHKEWYEGYEKGVIDCYKSIKKLGQGKKHKSGASPDLSTKKK